MAASFVQAVVTGGSGQVGNTDVLTVASGVTTTAGHAVVVWARGQLGNNVTGITDSRGNSWQVDFAGGGSQATCGTGSAVMGSSTFLRSGDTITVTFAGAPTGGADSGAAEFAGLDTTTAPGFLTAETVNSNHVAGTPGSVTTVSAGHAGDLAVTSAAAGGAGTFTLTTSDSSSGGTWTDMANPGGSSAASDAGYQIAAGASAYTANWAWSSGFNGTVVIVLYKVAAAAPPPFGTGAFAMGFFPFAPPSIEWSY